MRVLLRISCLTKEYNILVSLKEKKMQEIVLMMLEENKTREAFLLLRSQAEVEAYFPADIRPSMFPVFTLVEDQVC